MNPIDPAAVRAVLILKADRLCAEVLHQYAQRAFPGAQITLVNSVEAAALALEAKSVDVFVTSATASFKGDVLDLVARCADGFPNPPHVLVVTTRHDVRLLGALRALEVDGVFDSANEAPAQFIVALESVARGRRYWSPSLLQLMQRTAPTAALFRLLTGFEELVLSVVGDGCDDIAAARELGLSPATISTVRRELHRKLGVQHRGELVRLAAQHGFVRFTPEGVVRPGFSMLSAAYYARRPRRPITPLRLAAAKRAGARPFSQELARPAA